MIEVVPMGTHNRICLNYRKSSPISISLLSLSASFFLSQLIKFQGLWKLLMASLLPYRKNLHSQCGFHHRKLRKELEKERDDTLSLEPLDPIITEVTAASEIFS